MVEALRSQMDYILFIYGFGFFVLAAVCMFLLRAREQKIAWFWLGLFGMVHAINEWMELFSLSFNVNFAFRLTRLVVLALSFFLLAEFSRGNLSLLRGKKIGLWVYLPCLLFAYLGWHIGGARGLSLSCRYLLGFPIVFSAGVVFFIYSSRLKDAQKRLIAALGVIFCCYSFSQLVTTGLPSFLNYTLLNQDNFNKFFGFPVQLLRCVLISCASFIILAYWSFIQEWIDKSDTLKKRIQIVYIGLAYLALIVTAWFIAQGVGSYHVKSREKEFLRKIEIAAKDIDPGILSTLTVSSADVNLPNYERLKEHMIAIVHADKDLRFVYLMAKKSGKMVFLMDSEPVSSPDYSPPGQVFEESSQNMQKNFLSSKVFIDGPASDRWGTWLTFFAPIMDAQGKNVIAELGMDIDIRVWQQSIFRFRLLGIFVSLCLFILFGAIFIISQKSRLDSETLVQASELLNNIINSSPDCIFVKDAGLRIIMHNEVYTEAIEKHNASFKIQGPEREDREVLEGKTIHNPNVSFNIGGNSKVFDVVKMPMRVAGGKIAGIFCFARDITERKRAEEELQWKTTLLESQVEASLDGLLVVGKNGQRILTNQRLLDLFRVPKYIIEDKKDEALLEYVVSRTKNPGQFIDKVRYLYSHATEKSRDEIEFKSGEIFDRYSSPVNDKNGAYLGRIWTFRDITESKRMYYELRDSEERYRVFFNGSLDALMTIEPSTYLFSSANPAALEMYGIKDAQTFTMFGPWNVSPEVQPDGQPSSVKARDMIDKAMKEGSSYFEWTHKRLNGEEFPCTVLLNVLSFQEKKVIQATVHDITEHKRSMRLLEESMSTLEQQTKALDAQLKETEKSRALTASMLEDNNRIREALENSLAELKVAHRMMMQVEKLEAVGRLASGVAHEVKNPLEIILQGINYFEGHISSKKKEAKDVLQLIKKSVLRANKIIRTLVDYSRVSDISLQPKKVIALIESSLTLVQPLVKMENINIVRDYQDGLPDISADKVRIEQVFINLFTNALDAMSMGGALTLRSYLSRFNAASGNIRGSNFFKPQEEVVVVEVEDTGEGISEENIKKIFDPFFTTKDPGKGTGMGLSVALGIIEAHKGAIEVVSQLGKGTKVTLWFKIARVG